MLKTLDQERIWLVDQPSHGALAGLLAAHWGNRQFARPGFFEPGPHSDWLRREVVVAIGAHDNGWWEWEADPQESEEGLPLGLGEVLDQPQEGMLRWQLGVRRLAETHPFAALMIGDHAAWLYAAQFEKGFPEELIHPIQRNRSTYPAEMLPQASEFLRQIRQLQQGLEERLSGHERGREALRQRQASSRLLQILDAFSLALCSSMLGPQGLGRDELVFRHVPRQSWSDRVELRLIPQGWGRLQVQPFPFGGDGPLRCSVPARRVESGQWWRQVAPELLEFEICP